MVKNIIGALVFLLSIHSYAGADEMSQLEGASLLTVEDSAPQVIEASELRLLGRPIEGRRTDGETIALHCLEFTDTIQNCTKMSYVLFQGKTATLIGKTISVLSGESAKVAIKNHYHKIRTLMNTEHHKDWRGEIFGVTTILGIAGAASAYAFLVTNPPGLLTAGVVVLSLFLLYKIQQNMETHDGYSGFDFIGGAIGNVSSKTITVASTENGWDWSVLPKRISRRKFNDLKKAIGSI